MTAGVDFDRRLEDWFAAQAPGQAPDRVLGAALETGRSHAAAPRRGSAGSAGPGRTSVDGSAWPSPWSCSA